MKRLKIILESNLFYYILIIVCILFVITRVLVIKKKSVYDLSVNDFDCIIEKISLNGNQLRMNLKCKENLIGYYYFDKLKEKEDFIRDYKLGYRILIKGSLEDQRENTNVNLFDYREYYYLKNIFYTLKIDSFKYKDKEQDYVFKLKNFLIEKTKDYKSYPYIKAYLFGDTSDVSKEILDSYKNIGIYHIFSISGSHLAMIILVLSKVIKKKKILRETLIIIILLAYYMLVGSVSMLRAMVFYFLRLVFKLLKIKNNPYKYISFGITLLLFINPFYIFDMGFLYSVIVSSFIVIFNDENKELSKKKKTIRIYLIAFLASLPITLYNFYEINYLSVLYNIIFIPIVSALLFPLTFLILFFKKLDLVAIYLIKIFESSSIFFSNIDTMLIFTKIELYFYIVYYIILLLIMKRKIKYIYFILLLIFHYNYNYIFTKDYIMFLDVGQGDSILISAKNYNILIDTGGKTYFYNDEWKRRDETSIVETITIPVMKSLGIRKLDKLILTHGDSDHVKEAPVLIDKFKIEEVYFNSNDYNSLEKQIRDKLIFKNIKHEKITTKIEKINDILLLSKSYSYSDENDSSIINYLIINEKKILLTGDASSKIENKFLDNFFIKDVDILKIGHHGSKTSTSDNFVDTIRPKVAVISVGRNNRYNHPSTIVLDILKRYNTRVYRTDISGAITIYLN